MHNDTDRKREKEKLKNGIGHVEIEHEVVLPELIEPVSHNLNQARCLCVSFLWGIRVIGIEKTAVICCMPPGPCSKKLDELLDKCRKQE